MKLKKFSKFSLIWYSQQFAIPFWIVGQVHLSLSDYHETLETVASAFLHFMVALGFWFDWKNYDADREDED